MKGSSSAPLLGRGEAPSTLPCRGAHDVGRVPGTQSKGEGVYVPRAVWMETLDSPLKQRTADFDARRFLECELQRQQQERHLKSYLRNEIDHQLQDLHKRQVRGVGDEEIRRLFRVDAESVARGEALQREEQLRTQQNLRSALDLQAAEHVRRSQEWRLQDVRDAAQMNLDTAHAICKDICEQARRKKEAHQEAVAQLSYKEVKLRLERAEKEREVDELRQRVQRMAREDEQRVQQRERRIKVAQAAQEVSGRNWTDTVGKETAMRQAREEMRQDRDIRRHQERTDAFYASRAAARKRQELKTIAVLDHQVGTTATKKQLEQLQKLVDLEAVKVDVQKTLEEDLVRTRCKKEGEVKLQMEVLQQIADKQRRAQQEGIRLPSTLSSMTLPAPTQSTAASRATPGGSALNNFGMTIGSVPRLDAMTPSSGWQAARFAEVTKQQDLGRGHNLASTVGALSAAGGSRSSLASGSGPGRPATKTPHRSSQGRQLSQSWSQGLSPTALREGAKAAARRAAASAADQADV